jgi:hypothetical protein
MFQVFVVQIAVRCRLTGVRMRFINHISGLVKQEAVVVRHG